VLSVHWSKYACCVRGASDGSCGATLAPGGDAVKKLRGAEDGNRILGSGDAGNFKSLWTQNQVRFFLQGYQQIIFSTNVFKTLWINFAEAT